MEVIFDEGVHISGCFEGNELNLVFWGLELIALLALNSFPEHLLVRLGTT